MYFFSDKWLNLDLYDKLGGTYVSEKYQTESGIPTRIQGFEESLGKTAPPPEPT